MPGRIVRIHWRPFAVPFRTTVRAAHGTQAVREGIIIEMATDDGLTGLGEASPLPSYAGGSAAETANAVETLARSILGRDPEDAWEASIDLPGVSAGSSAAARCGVETAVADLCASWHGAPLSEWLVGRGGIICDDVTRSVPVNATVDAEDVQEAARETRRLAEKGFTTFKVKAGMDRDGDLARVAAVREAAGPGATLRIDANGAWTFEEASALLPEFARLGVALCEQPVGRDVPGVLGMTRDLRAVSPVAIALDESCRSVAELEAILASNAAACVVIKPMVSGLKEALAMVAIARRSGMPAIVTTMFDAGVGTAAALHLAAGTAVGPLPCGLATLERLENDLVVDMPRVLRGAMAVPARKGLGVRLDARAIETYAGPIAGEVAL